MVNKMKYLIEIECNVAGENDKIIEVANAALDGVELNITDLEGVDSINVDLVSGRKIIESDMTDIIKNRP